MEKKSVQERLLELPEEKRNQMIEEMIDGILSVVDWETEESFHYIRIMRKAIFEKHGSNVLNYMDKQIGILGSTSKGAWARYDSMPEIG